MTRLLSLLAATAALTTPLHAQEITEFRIGLLGGENAQDRMASNECLRDYAEQALGVPVRLFTPADYNGVIQGLLGGSLDMAWLGASAYAAVYVADPELDLGVPDPERGTARGGLFDDRRRVFQPHRVFGRS